MKGRLSQDFQVDDSMMCRKSDFILLPLLFSRCFCDLSGETSLVKRSNLNQLIVEVFCLTSAEYVY